MAAARRIKGPPRFVAAAIKGREMRLHDSDNGRDHALDGEAFSQHLGIAVELALPEFVADHYCLSFVLRFRGQKHSSDNRFRAEQAEKIRSQVLRAQRSRLAEAGNAGRVVEADQRDVFKNMILLVPVDLLRDGRSIALFRVRLFRLPNHYELFRLGIRQWSVEEGVYNAEDCAVGRDSQGQRQYDDDQETGILQETANRDAHIQPDRSEERRVGKECRSRWSPYH